MANFTKATIRESIRAHDVRYIRLQFTDMLGMSKNVEVPVSKIEKVLNNEVTFDGSSIEGFVRIQEADMFLYPDLNTWMIMSWEHLKEGTVGRFFCNIYTPDRKRFSGDPRFILEKQIRKMEKAGFKTFNVGVEPEFFLFKVDANGRPLVETTDHGSYFDLTPLDGSEDVRRDIVLELQKLGFVVEASHHEVAFGQHEINFEFDNVLEVCDNIQTFKMVVKNLAQRHGFHATFMPKPIATINGSGMHVNCSLAGDDHQNLFYDETSNNKLSKIAHHFIAGLLTYAREFCLLTNPIVNSYKRLVPGYEAPCYVSWSLANRSTLIRIPSSRGNGTRIEIRSVDAAANPYLALAAILAAGLKGIEDELYIAPVNVNLFALTSAERAALGVHNLPESLQEAVYLFKDSSLMRETIGEHLMTKMIDAKLKEWDSYCKHITLWELEHYLPNI